MLDVPRTALFTIMLGAIAAALLGGPLLLTPLPDVAGDPTLVALGRDPAGLRLVCLSTRCGDAEWRTAPAVVPASHDEAQPARKPLRLPGSRSRARLSAPATPREARAHYSNDWRIGTRYAVQALRDGPTRLGLQFGAGYRLAPLYDDGANRPGPMLRGELNFGQRLGERTQWTQRVFVERVFAPHAGEQTFVKQSFGLDVELRPYWTLETDFAIRHDSLGNGGSESAESSIELRRRF